MQISLQTNKKQVSLGSQLEKQNALYSDFKSAKSTFYLKLACGRAFANYISGIFIV